MPEKLNEIAFAFALAILSALIMLVFGIFGNMGIYSGAVEQMMKWHMFFSLSISGIITGIVESAAISFIIGYLFAWLYNRFV